jgi:hypothetical protein
MTPLAPPPCASVRQFFSGESSQDISPDVFFALLDKFQTKTFRLFGSRIDELVVSIEDGVLNIFFFAQPDQETHPLLILNKMSWERKRALHIIVTLMCRGGDRAGL